MCTACTYLDVSIMKSKSARWHEINEAKKYASFSTHPEDGSAADLAETELLEDLVGITHRVDAEHWRLDLNSTNAP